ncbi:hypothetical protein [Komagataeibacter melaceti]|nr:hypothetical protein [Komagataeibacter melaceti]
MHYGSLSGLMNRIRQVVQWHEYCLELWIRSRIRRYSLHVHNVVTFRPLAEIKETDSRYFHSRINPDQRGSDMLDNPFKSDIDYKEAAERRETDYQAWKLYARRLEKQLADVTRKLAVMTASDTGHRAQVRAISEMHPHSPLLAATDATFENGNPKPHIRLIFEKSFDNMLRIYGVPDPQSHRLN